MKHFTTNERKHWWTGRKECIINFSLHTLHGECTHVCVCIICGFLWADLIGIVHISIQIFSEVHAHCKALFAFYTKMVFFFMRYSMAHIYDQINLMDVWQFILLLDIFTNRLGNSMQFHNTTTDLAHCWCRLFKDFLHFNFFNLHLKISQLITKIYILA